MKNKATNNLLFGWALAIILFAACQKDKDPMGDVKSENKLSTLLVYDLNSCLDSSYLFHSNVVTTPPLADYTKWGQKIWTLTTGSNPKLAFEGMFNTFISPASSDWYIGTIDTLDICKSWDELIDGELIAVKNAEGNVGSNPTSADRPDGPYNVIGASGNSAGAAFDFGLGYYSYDSGSNVPTVKKAIVIWKVKASQGTWPSADASAVLAQATEAYVLWPKAITVIPPANGGFSAEIPLHWSRKK